MGMEHNLNKTQSVFVIAISAAFFVGAFSFQSFSNFQDSSTMTLVEDTSPVIPIDDISAHFSATHPDDYNPFEFLPEASAHSTKEIANTYYRYGYATISSNSYRYVTAYCYYGDQATGGGFSTSYYNVPYGSYPYGSTAWTAAVKNPTSYSSYLYVYVKCLDYVS